MTTTLSLSDPGALLGKAFVKIGLGVLILLLLGSAYMGYLAWEGFFTGWNAELDSELSEISQGQSTDTVLFYFSVAASIKIMILIGFLLWLNRKL